MNLVREAFVRECEKLGCRVTVEGEIDLGSATDGGTLIGWTTEAIPGHAGEAFSFQGALSATRVLFGLPPLATPPVSPITDAQRLDWLDADWIRVERLLRAGVRDEHLPIRHLIDREMDDDPDY